MIITRKATFFLGVFIFIIPFLGFPSLWKMALTIISGITLATLSVKINLPKRPFPRMRREKPTPVFAENFPTPTPIPLPITKVEPSPRVVHSSVVNPKISEIKTKKRVTKKNNGSVS